MKKVLLTGATGAMGKDALKVFLESKEFELLVFAEDTAPSRKVINQYQGQPHLAVQYGDLAIYNDIKKAVDWQPDFIINLGAMVSPYADYFPERTMEVNVKSIENFIKAIKESGREDQIKLVTIGSVAMSGNRPLSIRWARIGDPLRVSKFDHYGISKVIGERLLLESGLKHWVTLRQNGVLHGGLMDKVPAVFFHPPYDCCLEWVSAYDSAILLRNICRDTAPSSFWRNIYNIGGGEKCRLIQHDIMDQMFGLLGIKDYSKVADLNWFCTQNFHGFWATDSHELDDLFRFQSESAKSFFEKTLKNLPFYFKLAGIVPAWILKNTLFRFKAFNDVQGPMYWVKHNMADRIKAFWGSKEAYDKISPDWNTVNRVIPSPSADMTYLNHGYDRSKDWRKLSFEDLVKVAEFRGGKLMSTSYNGDTESNLQWQCGCGKTFEASVLTLVRGGHWCPSCEIDWDTYDQQAKTNLFLAQVVNP